MVIEAHVNKFDADNLKSNMPNLFEFKNLKKLVKFS